MSRLSSTTRPIGCGETLAAIVWPAMTENESTVTPMTSARRPLLQDFFFLLEVRLVSLQEIVVRKRLLGNAHLVRFTRHQRSHTLPCIVTPARRGRANGAKPLLYSVLYLIAARRTDDSAEFLEYGPPISMKQDGSCVLQATEHA